MNIYFLAGLYYGLNQKNPSGVIAFVNVGHSNLQVSIAEFRNNKMEVLATTSDEHFGGRDFDRVIYDLALAKVTLEAQRKVGVALNKLFASRFKQVKKGGYC